MAKHFNFFLSAFNLALIALFKVNYYFDFWTQEHVIDKSGYFECKPKNMSAILHRVYNNMIM